MTQERIVRVATVPMPEEARAEIIESFDGAQIRLIHYGAPGPRGTCVVVPGWTEPSEKYGEVALDLIDRGFSVVCYDPRGQGLSQRLTEEDGRGRIDDFSKHIKDLGAVVDHLNPERLVLLGHSMGGLTVLSYLAEGGRGDCAVLSAPATQIFPNVLQRMAVRGAARLFQRFGMGDRPLSPEGGQSMTFEGNTLTSDPDRHAILRDLLLAKEGLDLPRTSAVWIGAVHAQQNRLKQDGYLANISVPTVIASLPDDKIVDGGNHADIVRRSSAHVTAESIPGAMHEVLMEADEYRDHFWDIFDRHTAHYLPPLSTDSE